MVLTLALRTAGEASKSEYLKYWLEDKGLPLIEKWQKSGKIPDTVPEGVGDGTIPEGQKLETYWNLLEVEFKPRANKILSIMELWSKQSKQNSMY